MEFVISNRVIKPTSPPDEKSWTARNHRSNQDDLDKLLRDFSDSFKISMVNLFDSEKHLRTSTDNINYKLKLGKGHGKFFKLHYAELYENHIAKVKRLIQAYEFINNNKFVTAMVKTSHIYFTHSEDFTKSCVIDYSRNIVEKLSLYAEQLGYVRSIE